VEYFRTERGAYGRRSDEYDGLGRRVWVHVTGPDDFSPDHVTYPTGYDERCGWCWLGGAHSVDEHARRVALA
jgi:hypothetical protein